MAAVSLLEVSKVGKRFGGIHAVRDVSLTLEAGEIRAIIGPNGAGKTTLLNLISGQLKPDSGRIVFKGEDITRLRAWQRVTRGIVYTFQITSIFPKLSCYDNVVLAVQRRLMSRFRDRLRLPDARLAPEVERALVLVGLAEAMDRPAGELSYGHQRLLELAMGLALSPSLLILDEPTQGLAPAEIHSFCALIRSAAERMTILLIEHNMKVVLELATKVTVMDRGSVLAEGEPQFIERHPAVQQVYLGN
jgi:branched-chain amino acid transport system ATP-binding protein